MIEVFYFSNNLLKQSLTTFLIVMDSKTIFSENGKNKKRKVETQEKYWETIGRKKILMYSAIDYLKKLWYFSFSKDRY